MSLIFVIIFHNLATACDSTTNCTTLTVDGTAGGANCFFPFLYKGLTYTNCITLDNKNVPWCATTYNYPVDKAWGNCAGWLHFYRYFSLYLPDRLFMIYRHHLLILERLLYIGQVSNPRQKTAQCNFISLINIVLPNDITFIFMAEFNFFNITRELWLIMIIILFLVKKHSTTVSMRYTSLINDHEI